MNKIDLTKIAVNFVVGAGTTKIVTTIIKNNVQPQNTLEQIEVFSGSCVLGWMAADASKEWTNAKIDEVVAWWKTNITKS